MAGHILLLGDISIVESVRTRFHLTRLTMAGDRGMITSARIRALREDTDLGWLTCLRAPQIAQLASEDGPLQLSLFDERDLAEFTHPDYPNERLVACRNPLLATERYRKRNELLAATEAALAKVVGRVTSGQLIGADQIGLRLGKVLNKYKMAKHFDIVITDSTLVVTRRQASIDAEAALDGIYVLRTTLNENEMDAVSVVNAYKDLAHVERDFRHIKVDDLSLRPIEVVDDRSSKSTIVTSQLPVKHLHEGLGDRTVADAILDRLLERADRIKLVGESRRRAKTTVASIDQEQR